jgi:hypothetical protein
MLRLPFFSRGAPAKPRQRLAADEPASMRAEPAGNGYLYDERYFNSFQEVQCYRYLKHLGIPPGKVHHEYRVGENSFDFFPLRRVFWEHHPINLKLGHDIYRYGKRRRAILDSNGYDSVPLVVSDAMFEDVSDICKTMMDHGVDFRRGEVPEDRRLVFVKSYEDEFRLEMLSLIHANLMSD